VPGKALRYLTKIEGKRYYQAHQNYGINKKKYFERKEEGRKTWLIKFGNQSEPLAT
jgi:hypothetical protein